MFITFIVTVAVLAVLYLLTNICYKKINRPDCEFSTSAPKSMLIVAHIVFAISFAVLASEIIMYFFQKDQTTLWGIYGIFLFFAVFGLVLLCGLYFTYEAIRGDEVYVRRFFKTKKMKVSDIRWINGSRATIDFCGKNNKCLFRADPNTQGIYELIALINKRKADEGNEETQEEALAEEKAVLAKIGQEYKASYKERKKKFLITFLTVGLVILAAIVLLLFGIGTDAISIVMMGLLYAFALMVCFWVFLSIMKREMNDDDLTLGNKHKYENKKVKGASKNKFKSMCIVCSCGMVCGVVLSVLTLLIVFAEKPSYDEFTPVTGTLEYCREHYGKYSYIAIGFCDVPTEYRLDSINLDELDYSFFKEVKAGDTVTVLIDNDEDREFSLRGVSKKQWNSFYYLATDDKAYFTQESYIKSHERNDRAGFMLGGVGIAIFVASAVTLLSTYFVCKKREKQEDIVIYKS